MKKHIVMLTAFLLAVAGFAQKPLVKGEMFAKTTIDAVQNTEIAEAQQQPRNMMPSTRARALKKAATAADFVGEYTWNYKLCQTYSTDLTSLETTSYSNKVSITQSKTTSGGLTISGMFPNDLEATISNTENYGRIVIKRGQTAGTSEYGDYAVHGFYYYEEGEMDEAGWYLENIFCYLLDDGSIYINDWIVRKLTGGQYDGYDLKPYYVIGSTLTPVVDSPTLVTPPAGALAVAKEYTMTSDDDDSVVPVNVAVYGSDVYFQGMSYYLPNAWVKGTKSGNQVTFASMQYMGDYYSYGSSYFFYNGEAVFTYNANADTYSATGQICGVLADKYYDGNYTNPVLKRVVERAVMPQDPLITSMQNGDYGWYLNFNVPIVDINGEGLLRSKLAYIIYTDTEGTISPLTFTPATHEKLTENITEIPYGFTENWDFYDSTIFLNGLYSEDWNNIGIKSIYRGGGKLNETEIQWFHIKDYTIVEDGIVFDFNKMDVPVSTSSLNSKGKILEEKTFTQDIVSLSISPKISGTDNSFWSTSAGPQLRMYSGTLTFCVPLGKGITGIKFNHNGYWGANTIDGTTIPNDATNNVATWTLAEGVNPYQEVVVTIGGSSRINSIVVTVDDAEAKPVEVPADLVTETYHFNGYDTYDKKEVTFDVMVGFYGENNVYIQGLSQNVPEGWVKGALKGTTLTIPETYLGICRNKFGEFDLYFSGATFVYNAEAGTFTSENGYVSYETPDDQYWKDEFTNVVLTKLVKDAIPADPSITSITDTGSHPNVCFFIPTKDVDGYQLYTQNLYYQIWIEKNGGPRPLVLSANLYEALDKDMSEIRYTFSDSRDIYNNMVYLNQDANEIATWTKIGIQSIYYGETKCNKSNVIWSETPTDITHLFWDKEQDTTIFNLTGQRVQKAQKGLYIMKQGSAKANGKKILK